MLPRILRTCLVSSAAVLLTVCGMSRGEAAPRPPHGSRPERSQPGSDTHTGRPGQIGDPTKLHVVLEIALRNEDWGEIVLELDEEKAPVTVKNFLRYVDEGFYDGTMFHRVIPHYLIQGGGFIARGRPKIQGAHPPIANEAKNGLSNERGTIAMARAKDPHSATSQFFINLVDNRKLDHPGHDGWGYCVFGRVVSGMEVVDRIKAVRTRRNTIQGGDVTPSEPVRAPMIKRAHRLKTGEAPEPAPSTTPATTQPPGKTSPINPRPTVPPGQPRPAASRPVPADDED